MKYIIVPLSGNATSRGHRICLDNQCLDNRRCTVTYPTKKTKLLMSALFNLCDVTHLHEILKTICTYCYCRMFVPNTMPLSSGGRLSQHFHHLLIVICGFYVYGRPSDSAFSTEKRQLPPNCRLANMTCTCHSLICGQLLSVSLPGHCTLCCSSGVQCTCKALVKLSITPFLLLVYGTKRPFTPPPNERFSFL